LYIEEEIYAPENQSPPLGEGFALAAIRSKARNYRRAGTDVGEILQASQRLAHAQSERQATACRLLPPVHWALLYTIGALFVSTFILFETGGSFSNEGRHILFTVLCGLMSFVLCVSFPIWHKVPLVLHLSRILCGICLASCAVLLGHCLLGAVVVLVCSVYKLVCISLAVRLLPTCSPAVSAHSIVMSCCYVAAMSTYTSLPPHWLTNITAMHHYGVIDFC